MNDKLFIFNDRAIILFLRNCNGLLCRVDSDDLRVDLNDDEKKTLLNCYMQNAPIEIKYETDNYSRLIENRILIPYICDNKYKNTIYERSYQYFLDIYSEECISKLQKKRLMIIGAGGIGTEIIKQVMPLGVHDFVIIDFDNVEINNLNRQFMYDSSDIGKNKLEVLEEKIKTMDNAASVVKYELQVKSGKDISDIIEGESKIDLIVCAADLPMYAIRKYVLGEAIKYKIPCCFAGVGISNGTIGPLIDSTDVARRYLNKLTEIIDMVEYTRPCKGSNGITNSLISCFLTQDIIRFLLDKLNEVACLNQEISLDFIKYQFKYNKI